MTAPCKTIKSFLIIIDKSQSPSDPKIFSASNQKHYSFTTSESNVHIYLENLTSTDDIQIKEANDDEHFYILGDSQDTDDTQGLPFLGNGIAFKFNTESRELLINSSLTGMPAVFIYQDDKQLIASSDIYHIAKIPGLNLQFDPKGLTELATIGHPINHRTLFKNISIVPAGSRLKFINDRELKIIDKWSPTNNPPFQNWQEYIDAQIDAMRNATRRIDLSHSFLSLTAGLDTRAIFALLVQEKIQIPSYTMSGKRISLDALRARQLCDFYGLQHGIVSINENFMERLPSYTSEASRLSGGLGSLSQAFEIFFYKSLPAGLTSRINGALGNQIGRSGTEGTGMRNASLKLLNPELKIELPNSQGGHWFNEIFPDQQMMHPLFLIQNESLYASLGNYCVGNHFAVQQTPYADHTVISQKLRQPPLPQAPDKRGSDSIWRIKLRDLQHRVFGQPIEYSFQRQIVKNTGGYVANCPINWGWRARGGVSIGGLFYGAMTMTDAVLSSKFKQHPMLEKMLTTLGIHGLCGFQEVDILQNSTMNQFVTDTLLSSDSLQTGIFDTKEIEQMVKFGMTDPQSRSGLEFALDVALAQQNFIKA